MSASRISVTTDPVAQAAIDWWVKLQSGEGGADTVDACSRWREADSRHDAAWMRLEGFAHAVRDIPSDFAHAHLVGTSAAGVDKTARGRQRRALLKGMAGVAVLAGSGMAAHEWTPWQRWVADYSTSVGERRRVMLAADIQMDLASDTAVSSALRNGQRQLTLLRGQMGISVQHADGSIPLLVNVGESHVEAVNARFSLLRQSSGMRLDIYEGSLRVDTLEAGARLLSAGTALYRQQGAWHEGPAQQNGAAWIEGLLVANDDRLSVVVAQLARYRRGVLSVSPEIEGLSVSGVFPLDDTDRALDMLAHALPITIKRWGGWWTRIDSVEPRPSQGSA